MGKFKIALVIMFVVSMVIGVLYLASGLLGPSFMMLASSGITFNLLRSDKEVDELEEER